MSEGLKHQDVARLLDLLDASPVLVDIGSSGEPPVIWDTIANASTYIGFDPDLREMRDLSEGRFRRAVTVNEAVTASVESVDEVTFYLTKSPYCSSTLRPDHTALEQYSFSDLFTVERETKVRSTTLDKVVDRLSLPTLDWIKIDSQGTDLRLYTTLPSDLRSRVLALDVEPGLIDAYVGEDLFVDTHKALTEAGFWLSFLNVQGAVRVKKSTRTELARQAIAIDQKTIEANVRRSPGWCECRYLRTLEWICENNMSVRQHAMLWLFAMLDGQIAFALDVAFDFKSRFPEHPLSDMLQSASLDSLRPRPDVSMPAPGARRAPWLRWFGGRRS